MTDDSRSGTDAAAAGAGPAASPSQPPDPFRTRFSRLFIAGLAGVASLPLVLLPMVRAGGLPEGVPDMPIETLVLVSLINPMLHLAVATAVGTWLAPKLGLVSIVALGGGPAAWASKLRPIALRAAAAGLAVSALTLLLDAWFQPFLSSQWKEAAARIPKSGDLGVLASGVLYGGITEEILLRWGMLSFVAWLLWLLVRRRAPQPGTGVLGAATVIAAVLFGLGHLPAVAAMAPLDLPLVIRTVSLNALAGLCFGWLFVRHHLEAAMIAHATVHLGFALAAWLGLS